MTPRPRSEPRMATQRELALLVMLKRRLTRADRDLKQREDVLVEFRRLGREVPPRSVEKYHRAHARQNEARLAYNMALDIVEERR